PKRRVKDGVTNAWDEMRSVREPRRTSPNGEETVGGVTHGCVVVLAQDVENPRVKVRLDIVELVDICVFNPVYHHFAPDHNDERRQHLARPEPRRENGEAGREDR